jgi:hypothetical protein
VVGSVLNEPPLAKEVADHESNAHRPRAAKADWLVALAGFAAICPLTGGHSTPSGKPKNAHGAIVLVVVAWLFWHKREAILSVEHKPYPALGWPLFLFGLLLYIVGRAVNISIFEIGSQIPVLTGALLILAGWPAVRAGWFPLLYVVFMIPLPAFWSMATVPLKEWISSLPQHADVSATPSRAMG